MGDITDLTSSGFETLTIRQVRARPLDLPLRTTIATAQATAPTSGGATSPESDSGRSSRTLFPAGIPAREDVIRSINSWLDEADRLARIR
jgi:hypothetical protein